MRLCFDINLFKFSIETDDSAMMLKRVLHVVTKRKIRKKILILADIFTHNLLFGTFESKMFNLCVGLIFFLKLALNWMRNVFLCFFYAFSDSTICIHWNKACFSHSDIFLHEKNFLVHAINFSILLPLRGLKIEEYVVLGLYSVLCKKYRAVLVQLQ